MSQGSCRSSFSIYICAVRPFFAFMVLRHVKVLTFDLKQIVNQEKSTEKQIENIALNESAVCVCLDQALQDFLF